MTNSNPKEEILGAVQKPLKTGDFVVDRETAQSPLVQDETVIRACCIGCGNCLELLEKGAKRLAKLVGVSEPEVWGAYFFEAKGCPICSKDYHDVLLKEIGSL